jgi:ribosomal protein S18 acetylase RimI-like enzyme
MAGFHPEQPHWYLPLMGVAPADWGRGWGSALMRRGLERCDEARLPAYLEATSPRNQALYERFGFQALGVMQTRSSPRIVPMIRPPR